MYVPKQFSQVYIMSLGNPSPHADANAAPLMQMLQGKLTLVWEGFCGFYDVRKEPKHTLKP